MTDDSSDDTFDRSEDAPDRSDGTADRSNDAPDRLDDSVDRPDNAPDRPGDSPDGSEEGSESEQQDDDTEWLSDRNDEPPEAPIHTSLTGWIKSVVRSVERFSRRHGAGDTAFDVDISIGSGLDSLGRGRPWEDDRTDSSRGRESLGQRPRGQRSDQRPSRQLTSTDEYNVTTHSDENEFLVTADVASVAEEDVFVGFEADELVLGVDGKEIERIDVPWSERRAEASVHNGILTVRIEHDTHD